MIFRKLSLNLMTLPLRGRERERIFSTNMRPLWGREHERIFFYRHMTPMGSCCYVGLWVFAFFIPIAIATYPDSYWDSFFISKAVLAIDQSMPDHLVALH